MDELSYRNQQRIMAIRRRIAMGRRKGNSCLCDYCGLHVANDFHEIFYRSLTRPNTYQRDLCLSHLVSSCLCRSCHDAIQNSKNDNLRLLEFNKILWGVDLVNEHIELMRKSGVRVDFKGDVL